jgi:hypothetical protein
MSTSTVAELSSAAEAINSYQRRVGGLAANHAPDDRDDLVAAIYEAERSLRVAERTLRRAIKLASSAR